METQTVDASRVFEKVDKDLIVAVGTNSNGLFKQSQFVVKTQRDSDLANVILKKLNLGYKVMDAARKYFNQKPQEKIKANNARFKPMMDKALDHKTRLNISLLGWRAEEQRKLAEAQAKAEAQQRAAEEKARKEEERRRNISKAQGGTGENVKPIEVEEVAKPKDTLALRDTTSTRKKLIYEVVDAAQIPRKFLVINTVKLNQAMRAAPRLENGLPNLDIPGVVWKIEEIGIY